MNKHRTLTRRFDCKHCGWSSPVNRFGAITSYNVAKTHPRNHNFGGRRVCRNSYRGVIAFDIASLAELEPLLV